MNHEEKGVHAPNEMLCATIARIYSLETGDSSSTQISYIIRRANLSTPVVLGGLYLAVLAREKASGYIGELREEMESYVLRREGLQKKIDMCLKLCENSSVLFSISLILSSKYLVDRSYVNRTWANILMLDKFSINEKERTLLHIFNHSIDLTEKSLMSIFERIQKHAPEKPTSRESKFIKMLKKVVGCLFKTDK
ncbi:hypothetical protein NECID01_0678 [Nematocida sp. AWRm77]|nr:hypothetical protein NECID01_0678 [Nematocida sp. AWRm77]